MKHLYTFLASLTAVTAFGQSEVALKFAFMNNEQAFALNEAMPSLSGINYSVQEVAFYASRVEIIHDGGQVTKLDSNTVFYVNYPNNRIDLGDYSMTAIEGIRFTVGVPQYLNHLDISQYPEGHALSYQTPSMHWGWSAGYMHFIVDAQGDNNNDGTPNTVFQLHCLGDANVHDVEVPTTATVYQDGTKEIIINVNLDQWLEGASPATTGALHSSTGINAAVMDNVLQNPVFTSPVNAAVNETEFITLAVAQKEQATVISWESTVKAQTYRLTDAEGRVIGSGNCNDNTLTFEGLSTGLHFVQLFSGQQDLLGSAKWIVP